MNYINRKIINNKIKEKGQHEVGSGKAVMSEII